MKKLGFGMMRLPLLNAEDPTSVDMKMTCEMVDRFIEQDEAVCQGCGACTVACMSGAMDLKGFTNKQIMAEVDAICK